MRRHSTYERVMASILALILLAIMAFVARAIFSPAVSISGEVVVEAEADELWPYFINEEKRSNWQAGVRTVVSLMGGEPMVGSRSIIVKKIGAKQWEVEEEILNIVEGQELLIVHSAEGYVENVTISMMANNGHMTINYSSIKNYSRFVEKLLAPWFAIEEKKSLQVSLLTLKQQVER